MTESHLISAPTWGRNDLGIRSFPSVHLNKVVLAKMHSSNIASVTPRCINGSRLMNTPEMI